MSQLTTHRMAHGLWLCIAVLVLITACGSPPDQTSDGDTSAATGETATGTGAAIEPGTPRLFLLIVVDQMRGDYLDRFAPLFDSGFARLRAQGQVFTDAHQDHALTSTSPGHATISTGMHPARHGIINNNWFDRALDKDIYSVEDAEFGRSPNRLLSPTLGDRLKANWPSAKVVAMGGKDRAAVLTAGHHADGAYWYNNRNGEFTTSTFYRPGLDQADSDGGLPDWVNTFHSRQWLDQFFATHWTPVFTLDEIADRGVSGIEPLDRGAFSGGFPYSFGGPAMTPGSGFYRSIYASPVIDEYVGEFAAAAIQGEGLGQDQVPDLLAVNFSAPDAIGHGLGPDSPELVDTLVRLDRTIGRLLDAVDESVGLDNVVIALSSDHGVGQVPEVALARGHDAGRLGDETAVCFQQLGQRLTEQFGLQDTSWLPSLFYFDRSVLTERGVDLDAIRDAVASGVKACPRVRRVIRPSELKSPSDDPLLELYRNNYLAEASPDLFVHLEPNTLATSTTASHGSAHRYDTWVPMLFVIPGLSPQTIADQASVTDIVPTVAAVLGLPDSDYDGVDWLPRLQDN